MPLSIDRMIAASLPILPRALVRLVSSRYLAGEEPEKALALASEIENAGYRTTMDILGEHCTRREQASAATEEYLELLREQADREIDRNVSMKLTQLGLKLDRNFCLDNVRRLADLSVELDAKLRIDMEDNSCTDDTIWVFRNVRKSFQRAGIVLQARLHRTLADVEALAELTPDYRLCKGIYLEDPSISYHDYEKINENYLRILEAMFAGGSYVGIATHDENLIPPILAMIERMGLSGDRYEFQMLLGVRERLQQRLLAGGHGVRIYLPFGRDWYAYSLRRLKENPTIAGHILRAMFTRR